MPNVISSAIVNTPPPEMLADVLNKRNKVHHLNGDTDEDMILLFTHDVDGTPRNNKRLLPRRNWCSIREYHPAATPDATPEPSLHTPSPPGSPRPGTLPRSLSVSLSLSRQNSLATSRPANFLRRLSTRGRNQRSGPPSTEAIASPGLAGGSDAQHVPPHPPRRTSTNASAMTTPLTRPTPFHRQTTGFLENKTKRQHHTADGHIDLASGLDIVLNVEVNQHDPAGITMPYRLLVPALHYEEEVGEVEQGVMEELGGRQGPTRKRWEGLGRGLGTVRRWSFLPRRRGEGEGEGQYSDEEEEEEFGQQGRGEFDGVGMGEFPEPPVRRSVSARLPAGGGGGSVPSGGVQMGGFQARQRQAEAYEDEEEEEEESLQGYEHERQPTSRQPSVRQTPGQQQVVPGRRAKW